METPPWNIIHESNVNSVQTWGKQLCSGGASVGLGWDKSHGRAALGSFCSTEHSYPNPRHSENARWAQGPFQNKQPLNSDSVQSCCPAVKQDPLNLFFPPATEPQLCTSATNSCHIPLGAPARRKGESHLHAEGHLQGYFFSPLVSKDINILKEKPTERKKDLA